MNQIKLFVLAVFLISLISCNLFGECETSTIRTTDSPNNDYKLVFFEVGCGATTKNSYQLSVLNRNESITSESIGNILICYSDSILPIWKDENTIQVFYNSDIEFFNRENRVGTFTIEYVVNF
ncbi:hypothetical protein [Neolewinella agarilytica]|uniref:Lipoprotein n=1 Tax=Neolewinella agarilytica TaxID=478744 RepID=A0A1H9PFG7_9BACT|nr:hypothetical protein [Neolewinella agarilytica]SER46313.1 hypothetical protein SAMN05444359_1474 [Neolewinella agarilytica]